MNACPEAPSLSRTKYVGALSQGNCLNDLLRQPLCGRMPGHREPERLSSTMAHNQKCKQTLECQGWNHAKID
jgi:hypothetical protein